MFDYHLSKTLVDELLTAAGTSHTLKKGKLVAEQGKPLNKLILIRSGSISFSYDVGNGRRLLLGQLECNNTLVGEIELLNNRPCIYSMTCQTDVVYNLIELRYWHELLQSKPELAIYTAKSIAEKFIENQQINLNKLLLPLSFNIAKDCLARFQDETVTMLKPYTKVSAEAERFATTERAYRRVVSDLVDQGLVQRTDLGLRPLDEAKLSDFIDGFDSR
jgi:CRP-like cAMP-binding protein